MGLIKGEHITDDSITGRKISRSSISYQHLSSDLRQTIDSIKHKKIQIGGYEPGSLIFREDRDLDFYEELNHNTEIKDLSPNVKTHKTSNYLYRNISDNPIEISLDINSESLIWQSGPKVIEPNEYIQLTAKGYGSIRYITVS